MKNLAFSVLFVLISASAIANPFSMFSGHYTVHGQTQIINDRMELCDWWGISRLTGIEFVNVSPKIVKAILTNSDGNYSTIALNEYNYVNEFTSTSGNRAKIEDLAGVVKRTTVDYSALEDQISTFQVERLGDNLVLKISFLRIESGNLVGGCFYSVNL